MSSYTGILDIKKIKKQETELVPYHLHPIALLQHQPKLHLKNKYL